MVSYNDLASCLAVAGNGAAHSKDDLCIAINRCAVEVEQLRAARAEAEGEGRRLREALIGVRSTARGYLCWCDDSHNAVEHGHQPKCLAATAALTSPEGGEKGGPTR